MAEDFLPIQTANRPETAGASKAASRPDDDAGGVTFGELLDAQAKDPTQEAAPKGEASAETSSDDDIASDLGIPAATQVAPAPAPVPAPPVSNAVASMMAALQSYSTQPTNTAEGAADATNSDTPVAAATPNSAAPSPAATAPTTTAAPEAHTTTPEPQPAATPATTAATAATETTTTETTTPAANTAIATDTTATTTTPTTPTTTPSTTPLTTATTTATTTTTKATKATETAESASSPGAERAADEGDGANANTSANAAGAKASGQTVSPASAQANGGQTGGQANGGQTNAQTGADKAADIKVDAAATSPTSSTSQADASLKSGQTIEAPKHPALSNAPQAVAQVYTRMIERMDGRAQRFEIRLDPEELGRVDVRIEIGADKKVRAVLAAHDSAAMSDLMRGQKALERALTDAGIDLADGGLQFETSADTGRHLAGNDQHGEGWKNSESANVWRGFNTVDVGVDVTAADLAAASRSYRRTASRLDLVA